MLLITLIMKKTLYRIANYFLNKRYVLRVVMWFLSEEKQEKIIIERLRQEFMFFGYDTTNATDEEIKSGIKNVAKTIVLIVYIDYENKTYDFMQCNEEGIFPRRNNKDVEINTAYFNLALEVLDFVNTELYE